MRTTVAVLFSVLTLCASKAATADDPNLNRACSVVPCVIDSHGTKVGIEIGIQESLLRWIDNKKYVLHFDDQGLQANGLFYYPTADCSGPPYFMVGYTGDQNKIHQYLPFFAEFDGQSIWGPIGAPTIISYKSYRFPTTTSYCWLEFPQGSGPFVARQAGMIETPRFYPPFK
jgi:hypothetical protein